MKLVCFFLLKDKLFNHNNKWKLPTIAKRQNYEEATGLLSFRSPKRDVQQLRILECNALLFKKTSSASITRFSRCPTLQSRGNHSLNQQSISEASPSPLRLRGKEKNWNYLDTTADVREYIDPLHARHGLGADNTEDAASIVDSNCQIRHIRELATMLHTTLSLSPFLSRKPLIPHPIVPHPIIPHPSPTPTLHPNWSQFILHQRGVFSVTL